MFGANDAEIPSFRVAPRVFAMLYLWNLNLKMGVEEAVKYRTP
jgi:hypothetical protein